MADKSISELAVAQQMTDDAKLVVYQDGGTKSIEGQLIKGYAKDAVTQYVEGAKTSAQEAAQSAAAAQTAREGVETHEEQAAASATAAVGSADAAQEARTGAETARAEAEDQAKVSQSYAVGGTGLSHGGEWVKIDEITIAEANKSTGSHRFDWLGEPLIGGVTYRVTVDGVSYESAAVDEEWPEPTPGGDYPMGSPSTFLDAGPVHIEMNRNMLEPSVYYTSTRAPVTVVLYKPGAGGALSDDVDNAKYYKELAEQAQAGAGAARDAAKTSETGAAKSAETAQQCASKPPTVKDGTWWTWSGEKQEYVDTGSLVQKNLLYATFFVDPATGELYMETADDYRGPSFALVDGQLEVTV